MPSPQRRLAGRTIKMKVPSSSRSSTRGSERNKKADTRKNTKNLNISQRERKESKSKAVATSLVLFRDNFIGMADFAEVEAEEEKIDTHQASADERFQGITDDKLSDI